MASASIFLKSKNDSKGRKKLYIKFSHKGIVSLVLTPERIDENDLDPLLREAGQLRLKPDVKFSAKINKRINKLEDLAEDIADDFRQMKPGSFTVADMKKECENRAWWKEEKKKAHTWKIDFSEWIKHRKENQAAADNTVTNYEKALIVFERFMVKEKINHYRLDQITPDIVNDFVKHELEAGCDPSYVSINFGALRRVCHFHKHPTIDKEFRPNRKLTYIKKQSHAFTPEEIKRLYDYQPDESMQPIKDLLFRFIASGVRWSDQDLDILARHGDFLLKRGKKNSGLATIPITNYLLEVMNKPKPEISFWKFWRDVKTLCFLAGIDREVIKESAPNGKVKSELVPLWKVASSKIGRKSLTSLLTAAGLDPAQMRQVLGNNVELAAYQVPSFDDITKKMQENMGGALGQ